MSHDAANITHLTSVGPSLRVSTTCVVKANAFDICAPLLQRRLGRVLPVLGHIWLPKAILDIWINRVLNRVRGEDEPAACSTSCRCALVPGGRPQWRYKECHDHGSGAGEFV